MPGRSSPNRTLRHALCVLFVCAAVYWPWLGTAGFAASEGHRVVPGWTMLETGDWLHVKMFGLTYIRKPPGMPWAIAAFGWLFGESEWSARAVSASCATLMAIVCWLFARRWFGARGGLAAGLAQALTPLFWLPGGPGRTAEIEMLLLLGTQLAALGLVHRLSARLAASKPTPLTPPPPPARTMLRSALLAILIAVGLFIAGLAKGVASLPVLLGVLAGSVVVYKSARPLLRFGVVAPLALGAGGAIGVVLWVLALNDDPDAVRETGQFLWTNPFGTLVVLPIALISALPTSLAWLFPWGKDARAESLTDHQHAPATAAGQVAYRVARFLSLAWLFAALVYMLAGVSNPRYLLPASVLLPPIVGYVVNGLGDGVGTTAGPWFLPARARIARLMLPARGRAWCAALVLGSLISAYLFAHREEAHAGERVGRVIAGFVSMQRYGCEVYGDGVIEARPDVFLYTQRAIRERKAGSDALDVSQLAWRRLFAHPKREPAIPLWGSYPLSIARSDPSGSEIQSLRGLIEMRRERIGKYEFAIMREDGELPIRDESDAFP